MIFYGSKHCPDCPPILDYLKERGREFTYVDITESMDQLKEYLALRDQRPEFLEVKQEERVGIPFVLHEDQVIFNIKERF